MSALLSMRPLSCSELAPSSLAVIDWLRAVTEPVAVLGVPPVPPALPMPTMASPTLTDDELPRLTVVSPEAFFNWRTATSPVTS